MKIFRIEFATDSAGECDADGSSITLEFEKDMTFDKEGSLVMFGHDDFDDAKQIGLEFCLRTKINEPVDLQKVWLLGFYAKFADIMAVIGNVSHTPIIVVTLDTGEKVKVSWKGKAGEMKLQVGRNSMALDTQSKAVPFSPQCYNDVGGLLLYGEHIISYPPIESVFKIVSVEGFEHSQPVIRPASDGLDRELEV
jgi:hypothetical protein